MLKKVLLALGLFVSSYGLNIGDSLNTQTLKKLNIQKDKVYILDFFASWCSSCKIELPLISKLNNNLDKSKYKIIGINSDKNIEDGQKFVQDLNLNFSVVYDNDNKIISYFAPIGVPAIYYIKNNKIVNVVFGAVHNIDEKIKNDLQKLGE